MTHETPICKLDIQSKLTTAFRVFTIVIWLVTIIFGFVRTEEYELCKNPAHIQESRQMYMFGVRIVYIWEHDDGTGVDSKDCAYMNTRIEEIEWGLIAIGIFLVLFGLGLPIILRLGYKFISGRCSLTLTESQIYGILKLPLSSQKIQMPIDKLDNVYTSNGVWDSFRSGSTLAVRTASGVVKFHYVHNAEEFAAAAMKQIEAAKSRFVPVQKVAVETAAPTANVVSNADELKKYKELLDMGAITQEEFAAKKKQLLGL